MADGLLAAAPGWDAALGLMVALGAGLLVGLERERRKGRGANRAAAGIRSFAVAALAGGVAQTLQQPLLVALGAAAVGVLVGVAYAKSRRRPAADPGLTTELALFVTYLIGVLAVQQPALGAAVAVLLAVLLAARERLHRFAVRALSEAELHDALLLAALALVLLPLLPSEPLPWLAGLRPHALALVWVLLLALQAAGHVALRLFGARAGLALSGLFSGFVSSTATVAAMGARWRAEPAQRDACLAGALLSTSATWLQAMLMLSALAPAVAAALLPGAATGVAVSVPAGVVLARRAGAGEGDPGASRADTNRGPLRLREATLVALLLAATTLGVGWAQQHFGAGGALAGAMIGGLADAHASVAAVAALFGSAQLTAWQAAAAVLAAISANSLVRAGVAAMTGGPRFAAGVGAALALSVGLAWAAAWVGA